MKPVTIKEFTKPLLDELFTKILSLRWDDPGVYGDFLAQTHYHICHTTRLLAAAGSLFEQDQNDFHLQCMKHAGEERSHEKLSISDLTAIGLKIGEFPELPATKALYRNAYYLIDRVNPLTLFGYAYFLESVGISGVRLERVVQKIYGTKAVKHISLHAHEDPEHVKAYESILDGFKGEQRRYIEDGISSTAYHYTRIYSEIEERAASGSIRQAA